MTPTVACLADQMRPILACYGAVRAGVFGSYARGDETAQSDLDLLVRRIEIMGEAVKNLPADDLLPKVRVE